MPRLSQHARDTQTTDMFPINIRVTFEEDNTLYSGIVISKSAHTLCILLDNQRGPIGWAIDGMENVDISQYAGKRAWNIYPESITQFNLPMTPLGNQYI
jgi:hypothetical protein